MPVDNLKFACLKQQLSHFLSDVQQTFRWLVATVVRNKVLGDRVVFKGGSARSWIKLRLYGLLALVSCLCLVTLTACSSSHLSTPNAALDKSLSQFRIGYLTIPNAELLVKSLGLAEEKFPDTAVKWIQYDSGYAVNVAMLEGDIDVGLVGSVPAATGISQDLPIQVYFIHDVIGDNEAFAVTQSSKIKAIPDLVGKKIGVPFGSTTHFSLLSALEKERVDADDVTILDMQPNEISSAWKRGAIDGAFVWQPVLSDLVKNKGSVLLTAKDLAQEGLVTADVGIVRTDFAAAYPNFLTDYVSLLDEAVQIYRKEPMAAAEAIAPNLNLSPEDSLTVMNELIWLDAAEQSSEQYLGEPSKQGEFAKILKQSAEFMVSQKAIPPAPSLETFQSAVLNDSVTQVARLSEKN